MTNIDWDKFISVEKDWSNKLLFQHTLKEDGSLVLRTFSISFSGENSIEKLIEFIKTAIKKYVLTEKEIAFYEGQGVDPSDHALQYFSKINPSKDGKYGELILYMLVEDILRVPMVVFKIPTSVKDQVKGSDGVFIGNYKNQPAILLGESKTWKNLEKALKNAFASLNRFYENSDAIKNEFFVASKSIKEKNLSEEDLNFIWKCLTTDSDEYKNRLKVHPVLIVYDSKEILEALGGKPEEIENKVKEAVENSIQGSLAEIKKLCSEFKDVAKANLDFFLIPVDNLTKFRNSLYKSFHGEEWKPKKKQQKEKVTEKKASQEEE